MVMFTYKNIHTKFSIFDEFLHLNFHMYSSKTGQLQYVRGKELLSRAFSYKGLEEQIKTLPRKEP